MHYTIAPWINNIVTRCGAIRFRLCWRHSDKFLVCFGAKDTQRGLRMISPARPEVEEWRKVWEMTERVSWQRRAGETSRLVIAVKRRRRTLSTEVSMASGKIHACYRLQMQWELHKKRHIEFPLLALGADPSPCLFVCSFFHPFGCVLCDRKEMCDTPGRKSLHGTLAISSLV